MAAPYFEEDSDYGTDDEYDLSTIHLGLADGPLENDDEANPLVSRIGGRPAWLPLKPSNLPPADLVHCTLCKQPMELLVQIFAPLEGSSYDRNLMVWGCPLAECQRKGEGSLRVIRMLKYNARWAAKLEKQRKRQEEREARLAERKKKEEEADAERSRREREVNPFSMSVSGNQTSLFGSDSLFTPSSGPAKMETDVQELNQSENIIEEDEEDDNDDDYDEEERLAEELAIKASLEEQRAQLGSDNDWARTAPCYTPALYLNTIPEPARAKQVPQAPTNAIIERAAQTGADMNAKDEEEYERMTLEGMDDVFERFTARLGSEARQVVRYEFDGVPLPFTGLSSVYRKLWPGGRYDASNVPPCSSCGAARVFEVQLMPNLANLLRPEQLEGLSQPDTPVDVETRRRAEIASMLGIEIEKAGDTKALRTGIVWSTAIIFVCSKDCCASQGEGWTEEWAAVQFEKEP